MKLLALSGVLFLAFLFTYESAHLAASIILGGGSLVCLCLAIVLGHRAKPAAPGGDQ